MELDTNNQLKASLLEAKRDEIHYLDQIYKYMKYLEHTYKAGKLQDKEKAFQIEISLSNVSKQRKHAKQQLKDLTNDNTTV
jgi:hypothetical protein